MYKEGTVVDEIVLDQDTHFVRVYNEVHGKPAGGFVMREEDIAGLTPEQIKDRFALEYTPTHVADAEIPAGSLVRRGICGPIDGWGNGDGLQFDLAGEHIGTFSEGRPLP